MTATPNKRANVTAARYLSAVEYDQQKARLDNSFRTTGDDIHIATHILITLPDGSPRSSTTWVRRVTSGLLPRADTLAFSADDYPGEHFTVGWDDATELAGRLPHEEPDCDPPRWHHHDWPDTETLASLKANSSPPLPSR